YTRPKMFFASSTYQSFPPTEIIFGTVSRNNRPPHFQHIKADNLDLRPVHHYLEDRVRAHVFLCMLAAHLTSHLRAPLAEPTFTDEPIPPGQDPVAAAQRPTQASRKDGTKQTGTGLPATSFHDLLDHMATLTRDNITIAGQHTEKLAAPTDRQARAFQ